MFRNTEVPKHLIVEFTQQKHKFCVCIPVINEGEKKVENNKKTNTKQARKLSESISQEVASIKFLKENPNAKLVGKTNRGNLVFENDNTKYRISSKGMII